MSHFIKKRAVEQLLGKGFVILSLCFPFLNQVPAFPAAVFGIAGKQYDVIRSVKLHGQREAGIVDMAVEPQRQRAGAAEPVVLYGAPAIDLVTVAVDHGGGGMLSVGRSALDEGNDVFLCKRKIIC